MQPTEDNNQNSSIIKSAKAKEVLRRQLSAIYEADHEFQGDQTTPIQFVVKDDSPEGIVFACMLQEITLLQDDIVELKNELKTLKEGKSNG